MLVVFTLAVLAQAPPPANASPPTLEARIHAVENGLALEERVGAVEADLAAHGSSKDEAKRLADLRRKLDEGDSSAWARIKDVLTWLGTGVFFTFILGLLKLRLIDNPTRKHVADLETKKAQHAETSDTNRWAHERGLALIEQANKWRTSYLEVALRPSPSWAERGMVLRFLASTPDEVGLKSWATAELKRAEETTTLRYDLNEDEARLELLKAQLSFATTKASKETLEARITPLDAQITERRRRLLVLDPSNPQAAPAS